MYAGMIAEKELVKQCLKNNHAAQEVFYRMFARKMYGICLRFARAGIEADDILQEGFIKVFINLPKFEFKGSLEGWIRRIIVNSAIDYSKKHIHDYQEIDIENTDQYEVAEDDITSRLAADDIITLIQELPDSKRIIFNLFAYEGYSHKEIAEMLNISVMTSKSQLSKAKKMLQERLLQLKLTNYENVR
jgi:RNA polymerase sigma factor (sigma-70 family)